MFAVASLMLNLTPGNDMIYVASRSAGQGMKAGIVSAFGIMGGCIVHLIAAVIGLSALISQSAIAFTTVKYLGAVYLVYLGIRSIFGESKFEFSRSSQETAYPGIFWQGVLTNVLNPKVAIFFLAFLPQFVTVNSKDSHLHILFLGIWFNVSGAIVNVLVAVLFGKLGNWLSNWSGFVKWQQKITGILLIGLGVRVATTDNS